MIKWWNPEYHSRWERFEFWVYELWVWWREFHMRRHRKRQKG